MNAIVNAVVPLTAPLQETLEARAFRAAVRQAHLARPALARFAARLGDTPLVELPGPRGGARIVAKLESYNPAGSIKDRTAHAMLALHFADSGTRPVEHVLEYSGGNLARPLSGLCSRMGVPLTLVLSSGSPPSLLRRLTDDATDIVLVDKRAGFRAVIEAANDIAATTRSVTYLYQHRNAVNPLVHELETGAELAAALPVAPSAWVASIGTGGTLVGVARALRRVNPRLMVVGVTPAEMPYGTDSPGDGTPRYAGSGGLGDGIRQPMVRAEPGITRHEHVGYLAALAAMGRIRAETGLLAGSSAAANWIASCRVAAELTSGEVVATVFPCAGTPEEWELVPQ